MRPYRNEQDERTVFVLGPVAVIPDRQGKGVGQRPPAAVSAHFHLCAGHCARRERFGQRLPPVDHSRRGR
jgi:predicted N-acetyltransferase YhbS